MAFKMKGMSFKGSAFKSTYGGTGKGIMPDESIKQYKQRRANERAAKAFGMSYDETVKARKEGRLTSSPYEPKTRIKKRDIQKAVTLDSRPAERVTKKRDKALLMQPRRGTDKAILLNAKTPRSVTKPSRNKIQRRKTRPRVSLDINLMDKLNLRKGQGKGAKLQTRTKTRLVKKRTPKTGGKTGKVFVNLKEMNLLNKMSGSNS